MNRKIDNKQNVIRQEMEQLLKQAANELPMPQKELPMLQTADKRTFIHAWHPFGRMAAALLALALLGCSTAVAASSDLRQAVIQFFSGGTKENPPYTELSEKNPSSETHSTENAQKEPLRKKTQTAGSVTLLQNQALDEHFTASYLSSPDYLAATVTPSGKDLFYTINRETQETVYYCLENGNLTAFPSEVHTKTGSAVLKKLPGIQDAADGPWTLTDVEVTFTVEWQQVGSDLMVSVSDTQPFLIESASGEEGFDGDVSATGLSGDTQWIEVFLYVDAQTTQYQYPFLFNLRTGEIKDPLADVDFSAYRCLTDMTISDDGTTAFANAGSDFDSLNKITIDLATGTITEEKTPSAPVSECYLSFATGSNTVFYATGNEERMDGFLYDASQNSTKPLFTGAAYGRYWEDGFADRYVDFLGGNYAAVYKEPENQVYLLNLSNGSSQLLKGIPASRDVSFFWNDTHTMLSISTYTDLGTSQLAFFIPGMESAWYFDRVLSENIEENYSSWYGERTYLIQSESKDQELYYLHLYEYTP